MNAGGFYRQLMTKVLDDHERASVREWQKELEFVRNFFKPKGKPMKTFRVSRTVAADQMVVADSFSIEDGHLIFCMSRIPEGTTGMQKTAVFAPKEWNFVTTEPEKGKPEPRKFEAQADEWRSKLDTIRRVLASEGYRRLLASEVVPNAYNFIAINPDPGCGSNEIWTSAPANPAQ